MKKPKKLFGDTLQSVGMFLFIIILIGSLSLIFQGLIVYAIAGIVSGVVLFSLFWGFGELINDTKHIKKILMENKDKSNNLINFDGKYCSNCKYRSNYTLGHGGYCNLNGVAEFIPLENVDDAKKYCRTKNCIDKFGLDKNGD